MKNPGPSPGFGVHQGSHLPGIAVHDRELMPIFSPKLHTILREPPSEAGHVGAAKADVQIGFPKRPCWGIMYCSWEIGLTRRGKADCGRPLLFNELW